LKPSARVFRLALMLAMALIALSPLSARALLTCSELFSNGSRDSFQFLLAGARDRDEIIRFVRLQRTRLGVDPEQGADGRSTIEDLKSIEKFYGRGHGRFFIFTDGLGTVGTVGYTRVGLASCEIKRIYLDERVRGKGEGRRLVEMAIRNAREDGYRTMILQTRPEMSDALNLYEKLGFKKDATRSNDSVYFYSLDLRAKS
jgi:GNAT superfamily N-acetyltransferase